MRDNQAYGARGPRLSWCAARRMPQDGPAVLGGHDGFETDGEERLEASGVEKSWYVEKVDPADFYEGRTTSPGRGCLPLIRSATSRHDVNCV
jgi:hypothetical protein